MSWSAFPSFVLWFFRISRRLGNWVLFPPMGISAMLFRPHKTNTVFLCSSSDVFILPQKYECGSKLNRRGYAGRWSIPTVPFWHRFFLSHSHMKKRRGSNRGAARMLEMLDLERNAVCQLPSFAQNLQLRVARPTTRAADCCWAYFDHPDPQTTHKKGEQVTNHKFRLQ